MARFLGLLLAVCLALGACSERGAALVDPTLGDRAAPPSVALDDGSVWPIVTTDFLALVPADTPFVLAHQEALPDPTVDRLAPVFAPFGVLLDLGLASSFEEDTSKRKQVIEAFFGGPPTITALAGVGLEFNPRFIAYGLGVAPVLRLRLADADLFVAGLRRVDAQIEGRPNTRTFHGQTYLASATKDGELRVAALVGSDLVMAVLPAGEIQRELLPLVFGQKLPEQSLASTGRLAEIRSRHTLRRSVSGYLDLSLFMTAYLGRGSSLNSRVATAFDIVDSSESQVCVDELLAVFAAFPRLVVGFQDASPSTIIWSVTLELSPTFAALLAKFPNAIPDIPPPPGGAVASLGVGLDLKAVGTAALQYAESIRRDPFRCPDFKGFNDLAASSIKALEAAPPPLLSVSGVSMSFHDLSDGSVDGVLVVDLEDPKAALAAMQATTPGLHAERLRKRRPVRLDSLVDFGLDAGDDLFADAWVAMGEHSLGVTFGAAHRRELMAGLDRRRAADGAVIVASLELGDWIARNRDPVQRLLRLEGRLGREIAAAVFNLLSHVELRLTATAQGLGLHLDLGDGT